MNHINYVTFSAAGCHGVLFEGIWSALEDHCPELFDSGTIRGVAGTSSGSLCALMLVLRIPKRQRIPLCRAFSQLTNCIRCPDVSLLMKSYGLEDGKAFRALIEEVLKCGGLSPYTTMRDLTRLCRVETIFVAHDLKRGGAIHLSAASAADMLVVDAVFASCCVPLLFTPVPFNDSLLCDGVLSEHSPRVFPDHRTLRIIIPPDFVIQDINSWYDYLNTFINTILVHQRPYLELQLADTNHSIRASHCISSTMRSLETNMDEESFFSLIRAGYSIGLDYALGKKMTQALFQLVVYAYQRHVLIGSCSEVSQCETYDFECPPGNE